MFGLCVRLKTVGVGVENMVFEVNSCKKRWRRSSCGGMVGVLSRCSSRGSVCVAFEVIKQVFAWLQIVFMAARGWECDVRG